MHTRLRVSLALTLVAALAAPAFAQYFPNVGDTKSSQILKSTFLSVSRNAGKSTVRIYVRDKGDTPRPAAMGTVITADGLILTKGSEVIAQPAILVRLPSGVDREARVVGTSEPLDLALLKIEASDLTPINFADTRPPRSRVNLPLPMPVPTVAENGEPPPGAIPVTVGEWVASADAGASAGADLPPKYVGVISVTRRPIPGPTRGSIAGPFIGINYGTDPEPAKPAGVKVFEAVPDSGAAAGGIRKDDLITAINGQPVHFRADVTSQLGSYNVGDAVALTVQRGRDTLNLRIVLGPRPELPPDDPDYVILSGNVSKRIRDFPAVFQHDSLIAPNDCGGPLVDIDGHVLGINIARAGRTEAYALPADVILPFVDSVKARLARAAKASNEK